MTWLKNTKLVTKFMPNLNSDKLSIRDQITLFSSVHDFLKNGFNLGEAFKFCSLVHPKLVKPIQQINRNLSRGNSFAEGIKSLVNFKLYLQIKISELHGDLIKTLDSVSRFLRIRQRQKNKLFSLMVYPIFLLVLLVGIIIAIRLLVAPQIQDLKVDRHRGRYGPWLMTSMVPLVVVMYILVKYYLDQSELWRINTWLMIPLIGPIYRSYYAYYLASNLALMMNCGMDLKQIVKFMKNFKSDPLIPELSRDVQRLIDRGGKLKLLKTKYRFLPEELMVLIDSGDTTSVLAQKLGSYSKLEFKLMTKRSSRLISFMQPIMFLLIGLVITGTYLSMLLPMYNSIKGVY